MGTSRRADAYAANQKKEVGDGVFNVIKKGTRTGVARTKQSDAQCWRRNDPNMPHSRGKTE